MPIRAPKTVHLDELEQAFRANLEQARELSSTLSEQQLCWRPAEKSWSVADCLDHLVTTDGSYLEAMRTAAASAPPADSKAAGRGRLRWLERLFIDSLEPPPRVRLPAPRIFKPERGDAGSPRRFEQHQEEIFELLHAARAIDLDRAVLVSPASRWVRLRLGSAFQLLAAHQRRHLLQARRVLEHPLFPTD